MPATEVFKFIDIYMKNFNISQLVWQTRGRQRQGYSLQYDYLDRLTTSYYADINSAGTATTDNKYQEDVWYADARGNISYIIRKGMYKDPGSATCFTNGLIDFLGYTYNSASNRIQKIADYTSNAMAKAEGFNPGIYATGSSTYSYDPNGNLTHDPYKGASMGMTVTYNHLNLPTSMNFGSNGTMSILYDHSGNKLRKTVTPTTSGGYTQDYVNGLEYRTNSGGTLTLEAIYHDEGRITPLAGSNYQYEYAIKDHLGNTRLSFADLNANSIVDVPGDILQENHYYPFGLNANYAWMNNPEYSGPDNKYQYNGKEWNDDFGLNWNDYGARWYDASVGRWWSVDPLAEQRSLLTPYNYVQNNPILRVDPTGALDDPIHDSKTGKFLGHYGDSDYNGEIMLMDKSTYEKITGGQDVVLSYKLAESNGTYLSDYVSNLDLKNSKQIELLSNVFTSLIDQAHSEGLIDFNSKDLLTGKIGIDNDTDYPGEAAATSTRSGEKHDIKALLKPNSYAEFKKDNYSRSKTQFWYLSHAGDAINILGVHEPLHAKYPSLSNGPTGHGGMNKEILTNKKYKMVLSHASEEYLSRVKNWPNEKK